MSELKSYPATCSRCGKDFQARLWASINVTLHPALEALLLSGRLNLASCPHCAVTAPGEVPLLYHDMEARRLILALPAIDTDKKRAEEAKQALTAELEEARRSLGGEEMPGGHVFEPPVVFGYDALIAAISPEAARRPAPPPKAGEAAVATRERLREFTPEDVRHLALGLDLVSQAVAGLQVRAPHLWFRVQRNADSLTRDYVAKLQSADFADATWQWLGYAHFHGWLHARALWQRQYASTGERPSPDLEWLASLSDAELEEALNVDETVADAEVEAAQESEALKNWRVSRLKIQFQRLLGTVKGGRLELPLPRKPIVQMTVREYLEYQISVQRKLQPFVGVAQRTYVEGFAEGIRVENFLAERGLASSVGEAASLVGQAQEGEISAGEPQDLLIASRQKDRVITCSRCGYAFPLRLWSAVNIATDSHLHGILREGKIHQFRCAGCGSFGDAETSFQYYDPCSSLLVQVYPKHYEENRETIVTEFQTVQAYVQGLPPEVRPKEYPADDVVLFGMKDFADFLRRREPELPRFLEGCLDGERLMALSKEAFVAATANLDCSIRAWHDVVASSGPLQRLRHHRVWHVVRGSKERVQSTKPGEAEVERVGLAVGAVSFLGLGDGRRLHRYEWARRGEPLGALGPWLAGFTDPEIVHAVHEDRPVQGDEAWGKAFASAPTVQAWMNDFLASRPVREAVLRLRQRLSEADATQAITQVAELAYDRWLVLAMLLVASLRHIQPPTGEPPSATAG